MHIYSTVKIYLYIFIDIYIYIYIYKFISKYHSQTTPSMIIYIYITLVLPVFHG